MLNISCIHQCELILVKRLISNVKQLMYSLRPARTCHTVELNVEQLVYSSRPARACHTVDVNVEQLMYSSRPARA